MACGMSLLPTPLLAAITSLACLTACSSPETLRQAESLRLPAVQGGFDLMATDVEGRRLFVNAEDNGTTEVIDLRTWTHLRTLGGMHEPKWAVYRPELAKLYVSNGDGLVKVFGSKTLAFDHELRFKDKANNLRFEETSHELFVGVGKTSGAIAVVDAKSDQVKYEVPLANFPKQFEVDGDLIYVNVPAASHVAVLSRKARAVIATWPIAGGGNIPMGMDREHHRLFVGCASGKILVIDTTNAKTVAEIPIAEDPDGVSFDIKRRRIYVSCGAGTVDVIAQLSPDRYSRMASVPTAKGAATSIYSAELDRLFVAIPQTEGHAAEIRSYAPISE